MFKVRRDEVKDGAYVEGFIEVDATYYVVDEFGVTFWKLTEAEKPNDIVAYFPSHSFAYILKGDS